MNCGDVNHEQVSPGRHVGVVGLVLHPSPANGIERGLFRKLGQIKAAIEELHHEGVVKSRILIKDQKLSFKLQGHKVKSILHNSDYSWN